MRTPVIARSKPIKTVLQELKDNEIEPIYKAFMGMNDFYVSKIRNYHLIAKDKDVYNMTYLDEKRKEVTQSILALKREHVQKAIETIDEIMQGHAVKPIIKHAPSDTQDRIAYELQRQNDMKQWELQFKLQAREPSFETLKTMYDKNWGESDFMILFDIEIENIRTKDTTVYLNLMNYIDGMKTSPVIKELERLKMTFNNYASMEYFPYNLYRALEDGVELRNVNNDLTIPENFNL